MSRRGREDLDCKIYVGDLPREATEKDVERAFSYYGTLRSVWVARNPPGFAFVQFEDERDAEDAVRGLDGTTIVGGRVRVEHSSGRVRPKPWARRGPPRRAFDSSDRCYECGERGHYAYDCRDKGRRGGHSRGRSRSRSRSRDRYRSSRRRSDSRDRSRTPRGRSRSRSRSRSKD